MIVMEIDLKDCPSCGKVHRGLRFVKAGKEYRATCPFTGEAVTLSAARRSVPGPSEVKYGT